MHVGVKKIYLEILPSIVAAPFKRKQSWRQRASYALDAVVFSCILVLASPILIAGGFVSRGPRS